MVSLIPESNSSKNKGLNNSVMRWMMVSLLTGLILSATGFYLLAFSNICTTMGLTGIGIIVALITIGLLFVVPAKIYIILRFTSTAAGKK
jgi:membrane protein YdbS with pleckstrin-like domain